MAQAQHTPGPWTWPEGCTEIEALADPENSRTYYAPVAHMDLEWSGETMAANARLIAAAPELVEALAYLLEQTIEQDERPGIGLTEGEQEAADIARALLARIKGEAV